MTPAPCPEFHLCLGVWNAACLCVLVWVSGVGRSGGQEEGIALIYILSSGGCLCHRAQASGCHSLSNKQFLSIFLSRFCLLPEFSLSGRCRSSSHTLCEPCSPPLSSSARLLSLFLTLPLTLSHSLPLFLKSFCFSHMPVLSLTGSFSPIPPLFFPAFGLSPQSCQELATPLPPPKSLSAYKPRLIASSLGKNQNKEVVGLGLCFRVPESGQPQP